MICENISKRTICIIIGMIVVPIIYFFLVTIPIIIKSHNSNATDFETFQRIFLVSSNVSLLYPTIYCCIHTILTENIKWYVLLSEIICTFSTCLWSSLYHMCDSGTKSTEICITEWGILKKLDFIFSYQIIHVVFAYTTDENFTLYKLVYLLLSFVANIVYVLNPQDYFSEDKFYIVIILVGIVVTSGRFTYLWYSEKLKHFLSNYFNIPAALVAVICSVIGLIFKFTTSNEWKYYWWGHALWHIFIGTGIYYAFAMHNNDPLLLCTDDKCQLNESCCCKKNDAPTNENIDENYNENYIDVSNNNINDRNNANNIHTENDIPEQSIPNNITLSINIELNNIPHRNQQNIINHYRIPSRDDIILNHIENAS
jgi:hypothetical protein